MKIVLFDIDGTLIRSGGAGKAALEGALRDQFGLSEVLDGVPYAGRTDRAIIRDLMQWHGIDPTPENQTRLQMQYLARLPSCLQRYGGVVLPGVPALLASLHRRPSILVGLLTGNMQRGAQLKLEHFGLWHYFAFGGYGDFSEDRNEVARQAYQAALDHARQSIPPEDVWIIGDTPHDIACARAIGAHVLAVGTGWTSLAELEACQPDCLLADLSEAKLWWERLENSD